MIILFFFSFPFYLNAQSFSFFLLLGEQSCHRYEFGTSLSSFCFFSAVVVFLFVLMRHVLLF